MIRPILASDTTIMSDSLSTVYAGRLRPPVDRSLTTRVVEWIAESRSHRVLCLVTAIWLLNAFDLTLTILAHQQGMLTEENPLARKLLNSGPVFLTLFKVGLVLIGSYPLLRFRTARITEMASLVILIAYALLAVHWSECYELYALTASGPVNVAEIDAIGSIHSP